MGKKKCSTGVRKKEGKKGHFLNSVTFESCLIKLYNDGPLNFENLYKISIFYGMVERNCLDESRSENLTESLVLCFNAFFAIY